MTNQPEHSNEHSPIFDEHIREKLYELTLDELRDLSEESYTTANSGYLLANSDTATREDFIEELSEIGDKAEWQVAKIKAKIGL